MKKIGTPPFCKIVVCVLATFPTLALAQNSHDDGTLNELIAALNTGNIATRREAIYTLRDHEFARDAVPDLVKALDDRDHQVWAVAIQTLAKLGPVSLSAIPALVKQLDDSKAQRRYRTAHALGMIGSSALPMLRETMRHGQMRARSAAAEACGWMKEEAAPAIPELVLLLRDDELTVQETAVRSLGEMGTASVDTVVSLLDDPIPEKRLNGLRVLTLLGPTAKESAERLAELVASPDAEVRALAIRALATVATDRQPYLGTFLDGIGDSNEFVRNASVYALLGDSQMTSDVIPLLVDKVADSSSVTVKRSATYALGRISTTFTAASAVPAILRAAQTDPGGRQVYADAIRRIGPEAIPQVLAAISVIHNDDLLIEVLASLGPKGADLIADAADEPDVSIRKVAVAVLGRIEPLPRQAIDELARCLSDPDATVRAEATMAMGRLGKTTRPHVDKIVIGLDDGDARVRAASIRALLDIHSVDDGLTEKLSALTRDQNDHVRAHAVEAISTLLSDSLRGIVDILITTVSDESSLVRASAVRSLSQVDPPKHEVVHAVVNAAKDANNLVRMNALSTLAEFGPHAEPAVPLLVEMLDDSNPQIVVRSLETLAAVGSAASSAVDAVSAALERENTDVRSTAVPALLKVSPDKNAVVQKLIQALDDKDWNVRGVVARTLSEMGFDARAAVPALFRRMEVREDEDFVHRALRRINAAGPDAVPDLIEGLESDSRRQRYMAAFLLGSVGPEASEALPILRNLEGTARERFAKIIRQSIEKISAN